MTARWRPSPWLLLLVVATVVGECSERTTARATGRPFSMDTFVGVTLGYFAILAVPLGLFLLARRLTRRGD